MEKNKEINTNNEEKDEKNNNAQYHINRIINTKFINPYEVLQLSFDSNDSQIKRKYKELSLLIHPDKCKEEKSSEAFHILDEAFKTLMNEDKKQYFKRILRESKERVEMKREKENKIRKAKGLNFLPQDTFDDEVRDMMKTIIQEIEDKKAYSEKMKFAYKKRERDLEEAEKEKEQQELKKKKEWDNYRDKRVKNWNRFKTKTKRSKYELKPPSYKTEERNEENKITIFQQKSII